MEEIRPINAPVWDLHTLKVVRRELDKAFNSLTLAFNQASKAVTEETQAKLNKKANHFYDLLEKRQIEYEECTVEVAGGPWSPKGVNKRDTPLSRRPMSGGTSLLTI